MCAARGKRSSKDMNSDEVCRMDDCQIILFFTGIIFAEIEIEASVQNSCVSFSVQSKSATR